MTCEQAFNDLIDSIHSKIKNTREDLAEKLIDNPNPPHERYIFGEHIRIKAYGELLIQLQRNKESFIQKCME